MTSKDGHGGGRGCGCASCAVGPFTRNSYFTGKLLLERDFTDEQQYFRDKIRHHNQRLHGSGVVCGLEVSQHPSAGCQDRFVKLSPGTAIDCCGNEILVVDEQDIELSALPGLADLPDDGEPHDIRLCLRYHECGDEPIPVLYDDCSWDDDRCQPNRILEGWRMDAVIDPPSDAPKWRGPVLTRERDVPLDDASVVVPLTGGAIAVADGTRVQRVEAASIVPSRTTDVGGRVYGLELAAGGRLYATHDDGQGALTVSVLEADDLTIAHTEPVAGSAVPATTALAPDGRLLILQPASGTLTVYGTDLEAGAPSAPASVAVGADRAVLAVHPTSAIAYVAAGPTSADADPARVDAVDLDAATVAPFATLAARPLAIRAVALTTGGALVAARSDGVVARLDLATGSVDADAPVGTVIALGGAEWAYLLTGDAVKWHVAPLSVRRLDDGAGPSAGGIEGAGRTITVDDDGGVVYVAHAALAGAPDPGGVVVFAVSTTSCRKDWDELGECPRCDEPDCVPIATIRAYRNGFAVLDTHDPAQQGPAPDPADDFAAKRARIDNVAGRERLRSTSQIEDAIDALFGGCGGGGGGVGEQGPKGDKGDKGDKGEQGDRGPRGPAGRDGVDGSPGAPGADGEDGENGAVGPAGEGLEQDLTQIIALSWPHAQPVLIQDLENILDPLTGQVFFGLMIQFSREVFMRPIDSTHVFTVDAPNVFARESQRFYRCRCAIPGRVEAVHVSVNAAGLIEQGEINAGAPTADAIAFIPEVDFVNQILREHAIEDLWVKLNGEFVVDVDDRAIDAEFTRAELPSGDRPKGSRFGVQGGLFQSWFQPSRG